MATERTFINIYIYIYIYCEREREAYPQKLIQHPQNIRQAIENILANKHEITCIQKSKANDPFQRPSTEIVLHLIRLFCKPTALHLQNSLRKKQEP